MFTVNRNDLAQLAFLIGFIMRDFMEVDRLQKVGNIEIV
jgi:hypothetical protein